MANLTNEQLRELEGRLRDRQRFLTAELKNKRAAAAPGPNEDPTGTVGDAADESVARMMTDLTIQEAGRDLEELRDIDAALNRIADDTYGICENCGGEIEYGRLQAQPTALRCVVCQTQFEKTHAQKGTPTL